MIRMQYRFETLRGELELVRDAVAAAAAHVRNPSCDHAEECLTSEQADDMEHDDAVDARLEILAWTVSAVEFRNRAAASASGSATTRR
jgi:hypothetical protein